MRGWTRGHAGRRQRSQLAGSFCVSQPGLSSEPRGPARRGAGLGLGQGQRAQRAAPLPAGLGRFPGTLDLGLRLPPKKRGFGSQQEFSSPPRLDEAALKGLGLGCSEELDPSISIASTPKFGDIGGPTGPRNPPVPPPPSTFWGPCSDLGIATLLPGCLNGSDECLGLLWDFFF